MPVIAMAASEDWPNACASGTRGGVFLDPFFSFAIREEDQGIGRLTLSPNYPPTAINAL
jgi:hypothetical protein